MSLANKVAVCLTLSGNMSVFCVICIARRVTCSTLRLVAILSVEDPRLHDDGGGTAKDASKGVKPCWVTGGEHSDCLGLMTALGAFEFSGER